MCATALLPRLELSVAAAAGGAAASAATGGGLHGHGVTAVHGRVDDGVNVADHCLALGLGGVVADHALAGHDLAVQVVDALVQLGHAGGIGLGLGTLIVQVEAGEVELTNQVLQLFVVVVLAAGGVQLEIAGVSLLGGSSFFKQINAIHSKISL